LSLRLYLSLGLGLGMSLSLGVGGLRLRVRVRLLRLRRGGRRLPRHSCRRRHRHCARASCPSPLRTIYSNTSTLPTRAHAHTQTCARYIQAHTHAYIQRATRDKHMQGPPGGRATPTACPCATGTCPAAVEGTTQAEIQGGIIEARRHPGRGTESEKKKQRQREQEKESRL
jgi:hypothetical protein